MKIIHHDHSGRLRPHEHTSYFPLGIVLFVVGIALIAYTASAASPGPEAGSIGLTGSMPGKPPVTGAVIQTPTNQQRFSESPVTVSGTCPKNTLVEIFKNDIFAGSTPCSSAGIFSLDVDLLIGENILIARVYDALNQAGPDSNAVTVYFDALPPQSDPLNTAFFSGNQMLLNTDAVFRGVFPEQDLHVPVEILGGIPPYALNVQWGDSNNKVVSRDNNTPFKVTHNYLKPGTYQISLQASDADGRVAFLTVASIVNGQPAPTPSSTELANDAMSKLLLLWPLYTSTLAVVVSFWLGERREKYLLSKAGQLLTPQQRA